MLARPSIANNNNNSFNERNLNQPNGLSGTAVFSNAVNAGNGAFGSLSSTTGTGGVCLLNSSLSSNSEDLLIENLLEKKQKKLPEVQFHQTLQELGDLFPPDASILG